MSYAVNLRNFLLVVFASLLLTACATQKKVAKESASGLIQSDVFTGTDTVEFLATGVKDRVFFATKKTRKGRTHPFQSLSFSHYSLLNQSTKVLRKNLCLVNLI